ncbi:MAG TPA: ThiF family adenylyltransferase [Tepidisphaeraceae bacterium]|nr:ThiF family adenylyltransferase [Tepidisphaeraceae bacterium]
MPAARASDFLSRYHRQILLPQIGKAGQQRLSDSTVLLIGCGALGTVIAEQLVRGGVGTLRVCDRDVVEATNLQRQVLFDESDADAGTPKAVAAAQRLSRINSAVRIEPHVVDVHSGNIEAFIAGSDGRARADVILDGTDNAEIRYLINDAAVKHGVPWVYGGCVGTSGRTMAIFPGRSPCLRCLFPEPPGAGELETCDTAGVLAPAAAVVASLQVVAAQKILLGHDVPEELVTLDLWRNRIQTISTAGGRRDDCPACGRRQFPFLDRSASGTTTLCGRDAVQVLPAARGIFDPARVASRLATSGTVESTPHLVRCTLSESGLALTVFPDGRAIVKGTTDPAVARSVYARYVGS